MAEHKKLSAETVLKRQGYDSIGDIMRESMLSSEPVPACCTCGSKVEPDGHCPHGNPSILLEKKLI